MKYIKSTIFLSVIALTATCGAFGGKGPGSSGFEFLNIPIGAREIAMGSGSAVAHNAGAFWWNPAGLGYIDRTCVSLMYNQWLEGIAQQRAGFAFPLKNQSAAAVNVTMFSVSGIEGYDWHAQPTGELKASDYSISYSQAKRFIDTVTGGLTLKAVVEKLHEESAFGVGIDAGLIVNAVEGFWFSLGVRNAGVSGKFIQQKEAFPLTAFGGAGLRINKFILFSMDINMIDGEVRYGAGVEFDLWDLLFLRAGFDTYSDAEDNFRMGAGWNWKDISIDYAYAPYGVLGNTHRLDLNIKFGKPRLIERIYRQAKEYYGNKEYEKAWVEFNKVYVLDKNYKKIKIWLEKTKDKIENEGNMTPGK